MDERLSFPRNTLAADTGKWGGSTTRIELLSFEPGPGFWENFYDDCAGVELWHVQHVVRLPNRDGRAYFIVVHSRAHNGYITMVRTYPGHLNPVTDQIIPSPDGSAVGEFIWQDVYTGAFNGTINPVGNWNHPGKTELIGGVLMVAAQNWESIFLCFSGLGYSEDRVLFYDVRDPENVGYWGAMTATQLGVDEIDNLGAVRVPSTGEYILGLGTGHMFRSDVMTPDFSKWTSMPEYTDNSFAGQHGMVINSYQQVTPSPKTGIPTGKERVIFMDAPISGISFTEFKERNSGNRFLGFDSFSLATYKPDLPGADRDWDADSLYVSRKGVPILYTGKSSVHSDIRLYEAYDSRNTSLQVLHPDRQVTNLNDRGPGSLREAIGYGGKITFSPNIEGNTLTLTNGPLVISLYDVHIDATGNSGGLEIIGDTSHDDAGGVFRIEDGVTLTLDSATIRNGQGKTDSQLIIVNGGQLSLINSTIKNSGITGLFINGGSADLTNSTIISDTLRGLTEGIHNRGNLYLKHCTLTTLHKEDFSNLIYSVRDTPLVLENCIVAHRGDAEAAGIDYPSAVFGNFHSIGANLVSSHVGKVLSGPAPISGDPGLLLPERIGQFTDTIPLEPNSPAIDNAGASSITRDQNGFSRVANAPGNDLGAFEQQSTRPFPLANPDNAPLEGLTLSWRPILGATFEVYLNGGAGFVSAGQTSTTSFVVPGVLDPDNTYQWRIDTIVNGRTWPGVVQTFSTRGPLLVTTLLDENDGGIGFGLGDSLREAVLSAQPGELIRFAKFLNGGSITLEGSSIALNKDLTLDASTLKNKITIRAASGARIFDVSPGRTINMKHLRLVGGSADSGGAIRNNGSTLSISRCDISQNNAQESGGAIYNFNGGILEIEITTFSGNAALNGAGIYNAANSSCSVTGCWFSQNRAGTNGGGGAIYHLGSSLIIERCALTGNGGGQGGALSIWGASTLIQNSTLSGNGSELGSGGGLFNRSTSRTIIRHSTITDNVGAGIENIPPAELTLDNSIVANNFDLLNASIDFEGNYDAAGANLVRVHSGTRTSGPEPLKVDPLLGPLQSGRYHSPVIGSPVLDAGVTTANTPRTDQNNQCCRPFGNGPDLGAIEAKLSADASLEWLTTNLGPLSPAFLTTTYDYSVVVPESESMAAVRPARGANGQTIEVRINEGTYSVVNSKAASPDMVLAPGPNKIEVKVTARNGVSFQIYTINVLREEPPSFTSGLASLTINSGNLHPTFHPTIQRYNTTVASATDSTSLTAVLADNTSDLEIRTGFGEFVPLTSGEAFAVNGLNPGNNSVDIRVLGESSVITADYSINIYREPDSETNAGLAALSISDGQLYPDFSQGEYFYGVVLQEDVKSVTVKPTTINSSAGLRVRVNNGNFQTVNSGSSSQELDLNAGRNQVEIEVSSQDGSKVQIYTILVLRLTDGIRWVSTPFEGFSGTDSFFASTNPSISSDGQFVAFESNGSDLVTNDTNGESDIFVQDRSTGIIRMVSINNQGQQGNFSSKNPSISSDGRFVAFESEADNLVPGDRNGQTSKSAGRDVFVYDLDNNTIERVSVTDSGNEPNQASHSPSISGDGRFVAFSSTAHNLVDGFRTNGGLNVYVRDRTNDQTIGVSVPFADTKANRASLNPAISEDGNFVAFEFNVSRTGSNSEAYKYQDIYLFNRATRSVERITGNKFGQDADSTESSNPAISGDGRFVVFESDHDDLDFYDTNRQNDVFIYDRVEGSTRRVSTGIDNVDESSKQSTHPSISGNGRFVAFQSNASNLVSSDTNDKYDIFVKDMLTGETILKSRSSAGVAGDGDSTLASISDDGHHVAFASRAANLVSGDTNDRSDIFVTFTKLIPTSNLAILSSLESNFQTLNPSASEQSITVPAESSTIALRLESPEPGSKIEIQMNGAGYSVVGFDFNALAEDLNLVTGENAIDIRVTAPDRVSTRDYSLTVIRRPSDNADLADLSLLGDSSIPLTPDFSTGTTSYTAVVNSNTSSASLIPLIAHPNASVMVNGIGATSGEISQPVPVNTGQNNISVTTLAEDGVTTKTYTINITRAPNNNANLESIVMNIEPASGLLPFDRFRTSYAATYSHEVDSITITPTAVESDAEIAINGLAVKSGESSAAIALSPGINNVVIAVGAPDKVTFKQYFLNITRNAPPVLTNVNLAFLSTTAGNLSPAFNQDITDYAVGVSGDITSATVFPVVADPTASVLVNGTPVISGSPSGEISLEAGLNLVSVLVTGEGGVTKTYSISITREANEEFSIQVNSTNGIIELSWSESGLILQQSSDLKNWTDIQGGTSPYLPNTNEPSAQFYRLRR